MKVNPSIKKKIIVRYYPTSKVLILNKVLIFLYIICDSILNTLDHNILLYVIMPHSLLTKRFKDILTTTFQQEKLR